MNRHDAASDARPSPTAPARFATQRRLRPPADSIPATTAERDRMQRAARAYVAEHALVAPLPMPELREHAHRLLQRVGSAPHLHPFAGVLLHNELWHEAFAAVPFERRLLLLPKCLRDEDRCPAPFDEFGLLCKRCGLCSIRDLTAEAERLGYAVLVAEGSAVVMALIQTRRIEAIVGVSCLHVLEQAFPHMEAAAIPGIALPLLHDDCADTAVDLDWVWEYLHLTSADRTRRLDLDALRDEVEGWFAPAALETLLGPADGATERIARDWLARAGKRWRPFLAAAACRTLAKDDKAPPCADDLRRAAIAVECFHKASLIHDDIEDGDALRYGEKTLHVEHGVAVALNVGDLLIGEGYRLLAACGFTDGQRVRMLQAAAEGQRQLCHGQGAELDWARHPRPLTPDEVLAIFRRKTAPAFEVALRVGALCAGVERHEEVSAVLGSYSAALGVAYQIRDDLDDLADDGGSTDIAGLRPSLLLALAHECAQGTAREQLAALWLRNWPEGLTPSEVETLYRELGALQRAEELLGAHREEAVRALHGLDNASFKGLLRRVVTRLFNDVEIRGWCRGRAPDRGAKATGGSEAGAA